MRVLTTEEWERFGMLALGKFLTNGGPHIDLDAAAEGFSAVGEGFLTELAEFAQAQTAQELMVAGNLVLLGYVLRDLVEQVDTEKWTI